MNKKCRIESVIIIFLFFEIILFPYTTKIYGNKKELIESENKIEFNIDNIDKYMSQNFPGRYYIVRTKNQLLYKLFGISSNENVTKIGDTLFSTEDLDYWLYDLHKISEEEILNLIKKIKYFKDFCDKRKKKMLIILTPAKPRYYQGKYSVVDYFILNRRELKNKIRPYDIFVKKLKENHIDYFDCIDYINYNKKLLVDGEVPLFYKSGHHWSNYKGNLVGLGLHEYIRNKYDIKIPKISVKASPSDIAIYPDSDLFDLLNLYGKPNEKFYSSEVSFENFDFDKQNYIVQGGSFLGQLLIPQMTITPSGSVVHISNKEIFLDNYQKVESFDTWEEANEKYDLLTKCKNADMFIFEIHELNIYNATFGFLDFLIEYEEDF